MTDHEFKDMLLAALADIKEQGKERYDRIEKRLETIETRVSGIERDVSSKKGKLEDKKESLGRIFVLAFSIGVSIAAIIISLVVLSM